MSNDIPHRVLVVVRNRSNGVCERCLSGRAHQKAHRIPRNMKMHVPSGIADLCWKCHRTCTDKPEMSKMTGWNLPANSRIRAIDLQLIPALTKNGWVQFTEGLDENGRLFSRVQSIREAYAIEIMASFGLRAVPV